MHTLVTTHDLGLTVHDGPLFEHVTVSIEEGARIGLVGKNGSGKSSLLKLIAGNVEPTSGIVDRHTTIFYMPQIDLELFKQTRSIKEYCSIHHVTWPLVRAQLSRYFNQEHLTEERELATLSGGELMMLILAIGLTHSPQVLLLDEPTNHLDVHALVALDAFLKSYRGAVVVVSHDPLFLDRAVNKIWAIEGGSVLTYGGTYSDYQRSLELKEASRLRNLEAAQKSLHKAERSREAEKKRAARSVRAGKEEKSNVSFDGFAFGFHKDQAQGSAGKQKAKFDRIVEERSEEVNALKRPKKRTVKVVVGALDEGRRTVVEISRATLRVEERVLVRDINFALRYGDRVALVGKNGSGKSAFAQALVGRGAATLDPNIRIEAKLPVYVDQKYHIIDPSKSVLENMEIANPALTDQDLRNHLARFLFSSNSDVGKRANVLSGGEAARLTIAMVTARPIDLLVLDEPTNNLDIETLDAVADGLSSYPGALIVISHNVNFLEKLTIERAYVIAGGAFKLLMTNPSDAKAFYDELVHKL